MAELDRDNTKSLLRTLATASATDAQLVISSGLKQLVLGLYLLPVTDFGAKRLVATQLLSASIQVMSQKLISELHLGHIHYECLNPSIEMIEELTAELRRQLQALNDLDDSDTVAWTGADQTTDPREDANRFITETIQKHEFVDTADLNTVQQALAEVK